MKKQPGIDVGSFRHELTFQRPVADIDPRGCQVIRWKDVMTRRAGLFHANEREFYEAAAHQVEVALTFVMRWQDGITNDMRVVWQGRAYDVVFHDVAPYAGPFMRVKLRAAHPEGAI